jgi:hypothetical protein
VQVYVLASLWGDGVFLGVAYGLRHLTEVQVLFAPALALLLARTPRRFFAILSALACLFVLWNLLLVYRFRYGLVTADAEAGLANLFNQCLRLFQRKHLSFFGPVICGPVLLWLLSLACWIRDRE